MFIRLILTFQDRLTGEHFTVEKRKIVDVLPKFGKVLSAAKKEAKRNVTRRCKLVGVKVVYQNEKPLE